MQRIFHTGTITCHTGDVTNKILVIQNVKNAKQIKEYLLKASEEARLRRRTVNTLDIGAADDLDDIDNIDKLEALLKGLEQKEKDIKSQIDASIAEDLQERE